MRSFLVCCRLAFVAAGLCGCGGGREGGAAVDLVVEAERIAASQSRTPEDVRPYDESLSWHEYRVRRVLSGELGAPVIRVAHWTVLGGKAVPVATKMGERARLRLADFDSVEGMKGVNRCDELDVVAEEPPRFLDITRPPPPKVIVGSDRIDYGGAFSDQMKLYWKLRPQLRLVAMGNSHATKDIVTSMFGGEENTLTPVALNLAPPGACMELECLLIRDYVLQLPKLEQVIWVASPRSFNARRDETRKYREFTASRAYAWDQARREDLWPVPASAPVTVAELEKLDVNYVDLWGWEGRRKTLLPEDPAAARAAILKDLEKPDFEMSERHWTLFADAVRLLADRGVRVLLITVPLHPFLAGMPAVDPNGTTREGMAEINRRLGALAARTPGVRFCDFNLGSMHDFEHADFYDADHLNRAGARALTKRIIAWMEEPDPNRSGLKISPSAAR